MATHHPLVSLMPGFGGSPVSDDYLKAASRFNSHATALLNFVCGDVPVGTLPEPIDSFIESLNGYFVTLKSGSEHQISYMRQKVCFLAGVAGMSFSQFWNLNEYLDTYTELAIAVHNAEPSTSTTA